MLRVPRRDDLPPLLAAIHERIPDASGIWLFGSLARGGAGPDSDIDLAVLAPTPLDSVLVFDLGLELGVIAGRDVDLVDLRRVSTLLRHVVATEGLLLACHDAEACTAFSADSAALYVAMREEQHIARRLSAEDRS